MERLFTNPDVISFLVSLGASVTWDSTKAGVKGMKSLFRRPGGRKIAETFKRLSQDDQLQRAAQHLINDILKGLPEDQKDAVASDADRLADLVCRFLMERQTGKAPITQQLRDTILEHNDLPDGTDDETIASFTASVVVAVAKAEIGKAILLAAVEQVQDTVTVGFETQAAEMNALNSMLFTGLQDIKQGMGSSFSQPVADSDAVARHLANHLSDYVALLKHIGIQAPDSTYVDTKAALAPPTLPPAHVRRDAVRKQIGLLLEQHPILAVTGYPECGKTLALAEFAAQTPECFWLDFPANLSTGIQAMQLLDFALSHYLESGSASSNAIIATLNRRLAETPLLIVLDNAERLDDIDVLQPLLAVAEASSGRLRILMAYAEMPDFTAAAKLARVPTWRLPGMEPREAAELYHAFGLVITEARLNAIAMLCAQYDGHVGMLRLFRDDITTIKTDTDASRVLENAPSKATAADFLEALSLRFMKSVSSDELTLCRRLSVAITPFRRSLAAALWDDTGDKNAFLVVWSQCNSGVFERVTEDRFRIPYLYCTSLRRNVEYDEARKLHQVAADVLFMPPDREMTVDDAFACVFHYLGAGDSEAGLHAALALLRNAMMANRVDVLRVLLSRFALLITDDLLASEISAESRMFWLILSGISAHHCGDVADAKARAQKLCALLDERKEGDADDEDMYQTWIVVLALAAHVGPPELAWKGLDGLRPGFMLDALTEGTSSPLMLLVSAYLGSSRNMTEFVSNVFRRAESGHLNSEQVWDSGRCWELWRGVGAELYSAISSLYAADVNEAHSRADSLWQHVQKGLSLGFKDVAVVLGATAVVLDIDVFRDMRRAASRARILAEGAESLSARVRGLALTTLGDALRCAQDLGPAEVVYRDALAAWPTGDTADRAQAQNSLAVTVARLGRPKEGLWLARLAAREMSSGRQEYQAETLGRIYLECAVMAIHAGSLPQALVSLLRAHRVLRPCRPNHREWPTLAQVAMSIDRAAEPDAKLDDMPLPGFTFGLPTVVPGAEEMIPSAPDIMVARACEALGLHSKALCYFELCYSETEDEGLRGMMAAMMYGPAWKSGDLNAIVRSASRIFCAPPTGMPEEAALLRDGLVRGVFESTVSLARARAADDAGIPELESAREIAQTFPVDEHPYAAALHTAIEGLLRARRSGKDDSLAAAYQQAINLREYSTAHNLAWYWCFHFLAGNQASVREVFKWQWRLAWLTRLTKSGDSQFLTDSLEQQRAFWSHVRTEADKSSLGRIRQAVCQQVGSALDTWRKLEAELAGCACTALGYSGFLPELSVIFASGIDIPWLGVVREKCTSQVLDSILSPVAQDFSEKIDSTLQFIREIMEPVQDGVSDTVQGWLADVAHLSAIHNQVQQGGLDKEGAQSLLALRSFEYSLSSDSRANWFLAIGQVAQTTDVRDCRFLSEVMPLLSSIRITEFLEAADDLSASLVVRLRLLGLKTDGHCALRDFHGALSCISIQQSATAPITNEAVAHADRIFATASERLEAVAAAFGDLKNNAEELGEANSDVTWTCLYSGAQLRMASVVMKLRCQLGDSTEATEQLDSAGREMLLALQLSVKREDHRGAAFAAAELATRACVLGEAEEESEYCAAAMRHAKESGGDRRPKRTGGGGKPALKMVLP